MDLYTENLNICFCGLNGLVGTSCKMLTVSGIFIFVPDSKANASDIFLLRAVFILSFP